MKFTNVANALYLYRRDSFTVAVAQYINLSCFFFLRDRRYSEGIGIHVVQGQGSRPGLAESFPASATQVFESLAKRLRKHSCAKLEEHEEKGRT